MSTSTMPLMTSVAQRGPAGGEVRVQLGAAPLLVQSDLPRPQPRCGGWHTLLPVADPRVLPPVEQATLGCLTDAAAAAHGCAPDEVTVFSPRQIAAGVLCGCGLREENVFGQVGRLRCPSCDALAPSPLSVVHVFLPARASRGETLRAAGFPAGDMVWTTVSVKPRGDWLPWVFGPAEVVPPGRPRIGVVGLGAIGYPVSEVLVRRGYAVDLVDFDVVEAKNLSGSYCVSAVDQPKAFASRDRLRRLCPGVDARAWHGDIIRDVPLNLIRQWAAAVLCLDRASSKAAASAYLELLGTPYLQSQIDGASSSVMVRTFVPGATCCLQCLLEPGELEVDAVFGCRPPPASTNGGGPALFTTPVEASVAAGLAAAQLASLVPPPGLQASSTGPTGGTS